MRIKGIDIRQEYGVVVTKKEGFLNIPVTKRNVTDWGDGTFRLDKPEHGMQIDPMMFHAQCIFDPKLTNKSFSEFLTFCNDPNIVEIFIDEVHLYVNDQIGYHWYQYGAYDVYIVGIFDTYNRNGVIRFTISFECRKRKGNNLSPTETESVYGSQGMLNEWSLKVFSLIINKVEGRNQLSTLVDGVETFGVIKEYRRRKSYREPEVVKFKCNIIGHTVMDIFKSDQYALMLYLRRFEQAIKQGYTGGDGRTRITLGSETWEGIITENISVARISKNAVAFEFNLKLI